MLITALLCSIIAQAQNNYYSPPVKIPMLLSGNFAELRSNHFHSGIDIKTQGTTGIPIHSSANGFISRIVVSPTGYGRAIYIDHPNGTTTVYGHLKSFRDDISSYVKENQYRQESFKVDLKVPPGLFSVTKDEVIALSGNSGSSGGPHLHFEIRDTGSENPMNPLKYNFAIRDSIPPRVFSLLMAPLSEDSHVKQDIRKRRFPIVFYDGKYHIKNNPLVPVSGEIGFAVEANDYLNYSWNKCGIYALELTVNDELYFSHQLDEFSFDESKYINSYIDYETYIDLKRRFQKTWVEPGNKLSIYNYLKENGSLKTKENGVYNIKMVLKDAYGNASALEFRVQDVPSNFENITKEFTKEFKFNKLNLFETEDVMLEIAKGTLYDDLKFEYRTMPVSPGYFSEVHMLHKSTVPLHKKVRLKLKPKNLPKYLRSKALLVNIDDASGKVWAAGGTFEDGWISSKVSSFGNYAVKIDTVAPTIKPLSIISNNKLTESKRIRFKIEDELSGIKKIEGFLDGEWALFEYDAKNKLITHYFDKKRFKFEKNHQLKLYVSDYKGNNTSYEATFWK